MQNPIQIPESRFLYLKNVETYFMKLIVVRIDELEMATKKEYFKTYNKNFTVLEGIEYENYVAILEDKIVDDPVLMTFAAALGVNQEGAINFDITKIKA